MTIRSSSDLSALIGAICLAGAAAFAPGAIAQPASNGGFEVPARSLPVPDTVSPQVQKLIAARSVRAGTSCRRPARSGSRSRRPAPPARSAISRA